MSKKYQVIVMDPPWSFSDKLTMSNTKRGAISNYLTLSLKEIKELSISNLADPDGCLLALWCPSSLLKEGIEIMNDYNFELKQTYIWVKTKNAPLKEAKNQVKKLMKEAWKIKDPEWNLKDYVKGLSKCIDDFDVKNVLSFYMGHLLRQTHEIALIGINSTKLYQKLENKSQRSVSFAENMKHSKKPEVLQDSLELMFPEAFKNGQCIELFARRQRSGWVCLGNELQGNLDIRDAIKQLK